jgi:SAM-dependent methyltransferase
LPSPSATTRSRTRRARRRVADAGVAELVEIVEADARAYPLAPEAFDAALCLGASFVWDGLDGTLAALAPAVRPGGYVVVGEPY